MIVGNGFICNILTVQENLPGGGGIDPRDQLGDTDDVLSTFIGHLLNETRIIGIDVFRAENGNGGGNDVLAVLVCQLKMNDDGILPIRMCALELHDVFQSLRHIDELVLRDCQHAAACIGDRASAVFEPEQRM